MYDKKNCRWSDPSYDSCMTTGYCRLTSTGEIASNSYRADISESECRAACEADSRCLAYAHEATAITSEFDVLCRLYKNTDDVIGGSGWQNSGADQLLSDPSDLACSNPGAIDCKTKVPGKRLSCGCLLII